MSKESREARKEADRERERENHARDWYKARGIPLDDNPPVATSGPVTFYRAFFGG